MPGSVKQTRAQTCRLHTERAPIMMGRAFNHSSLRWILEAKGARQRFFGGEPLRFWFATVCRGAVLVALAEEKYVKP
jgi:hypothetical protein